MVTGFIEAELETERRVLLVHDYNERGDENKDIRLKPEKPFRIME